MKTLAGRISAMHFLFNDPLPCLNVEVVCGPRVLVVVHSCREDHGKDLKLSQPMLEEKQRRSEEAVYEEEEEEDIKRLIYKGEQCSGEEVTRMKRDIDGKEGEESNEEKRREWTQIREER